MSLHIFLEIKDSFEEKFKLLGNNFTNCRVKRGEAKATRQQEIKIENLLN